MLVSVPGTPQAQEALIEAQIPQQGTLRRDAAKLDVVYAGAPSFAPIPGTPMSYAVNTSFDVIQTGEGYFSCYQGAWFAAPAPAGPWTLAASVPPVVYTIPPASPMYPCTYVRVYAATPEAVTFGYTSGYAMSYVSAGVVVYGTGYYYPPYVYPAPIPIYYPYPYSYAGATYYNPTTGAWAQGGAIYGPYGGGAKGGTAYNPTTGAWAQGGAIYGPNGGAGAFSAYNPTTGSYAHGSAAWGPDGGAANANWYNANTGRTGSTQQNSNAYGRWGSTTVSGPNQTVHTQSQSNAQGSAGSFSSSSGAKGAGVSGAGGNSAGVVKSPGGDVYAGADGNVYKKTDSGWQKYDNGSWNSVDKPTTQRSTSQSGAASTAATQRQTPGAASQSRRGVQRTARVRRRSGQYGGAGERPASAAAGGGRARRGLRNSSRTARRGWRAARGSSSSSRCAAASRPTEARRVAGASPAAAAEDSGADRALASAALPGNERSRVPHGRSPAMNRNVPTPMIALLGAAAMLASSAAEAQWVMVARRAVGRVEQILLQSSPANGANYDAAAVMLAAPAGAVYAAVLRGVSNAQGIRITREDAGARLAQFTNGEQIAGIKVSPVGDNLTHMMISSPHTGSQPDASALMLNAVLRVRKDMGVECDWGQTLGRPIAPR